ncbi:MAG: hypothetical protein IT581_18035 [Verrucomicrobiales bacterium]|nr:hypothetical protein [Verrucomicrobiales bacterium]
MSTQWKALLMALGAAVLATGCGESSNSAGNSPAAPPPPAAKAEPAPPAPAPVAEAPKAVVAEAPKAAEAVKSATQEAVAQVKDATAAAANAAETKFSDLVTQVKKLIADGKGTEAVQTLSTGLSNLKLTDSQQKIVDDLKTKAQDVIAKKGVDAAKSAVGNLLKPKSSN